MMNQEYHKTLDYLCKNIPDTYAAPILQSYILRNFDSFTEYLATIIKQNPGWIESYVLRYRHMPSKMFEDANVKPVYPEIKREVVPPDADYDDLDKCCNERAGDKDLDSTGISDFIKTEHIDKEPSIKDQFTPSILLPVFNVFKKEFNECSDNVDFLAVLFNMYSGKSIKFMQQIQQQFSHNGVNDFIEKYILSKHPYTTKIIAECIKHALDIKITISMSTSNQDEYTKKTELTLVSQYAAFLMHSIAVLKPNIDTPTKIHSHITYVTGQIPIFNNLLNTYQDPISLKILEDIINQIPTNETGAYNKALRTIFSANKSTYNSVKRFTKKVRV